MENSKRKSNGKRLLSVLLAAMLIGSATVATSSYTGVGISASAVTDTAKTSASDFEYSENDDGTVTITGYYGEDREIIIPSEIDGKPVTSIGNSAFNECTGLTSITIPASVTSIGYYAFANCTNLASIDIPENITSVGYCAFDDTEWYTNQPDGVLYIGKVVYEYKGQMPDNTAVVLKDGTQTINNNVFSGCKGLTSIEIPDSVATIGEWAFSGCTGLTSITIPDSVATIGQAAFQECTSLNNVEISDSAAVSIAGYAFRGCKNLKNINISEGVVKIDSVAFVGTGLTSITVDKNNKNYSSQDGVLFNKDKTKLLMYPERKAGEYKIPDSVTEIGDDAFVNCTGLTDVTIPDSVTFIDVGAFAGCTGLTSVIIPDSVKTLGWSSWRSGVFGGCTGLTNVTIGNDVTEIGQYIFERCTALTSITIPENIKSIESFAFEGCTGLTSVYIPNGDTEIEKMAFDKNDNLTIYGVKDSNSEIYAKENGINFKEINSGEVTTLVDKATNISIKGVLADGVDIKVTKLDNSIENAIFTYDISITLNGATVQPDGEITVSIPCDNSKCKVIWIKDDGTQEDMNATYENGAYTFKTNHLSVYALVEEPSTEPSSNSEQSSKDEPSKTADTSNTDTPATADSGIPAFMVALFAAISGITAVIFSKRRKNEQ
ncbi:MAG: leucine-rich repeat domain-containing protein [Acutalibacteraceae bacterium]